LQKLIKQKHLPKEFPLHISVKSSILEEDFEKITKSSTFFKPELRSKQKEVLKYIAVGGANAAQNSLCTLTANIAISDVHYYSTDDLQSFSMEYDIAGIKALPVLLRSKEQKCQEVFDRNGIPKKVLYIDLPSIYWHILASKYYWKIQADCLFPYCDCN
jgi:hypothetical protein